VLPSTGGVNTFVRVNHGTERLGLQVYRVRDESTRREYALKKMRKTDLMGCSEHVFCEQHITRLIENPFVVKQYASFQDSKYL
jgi:hypothetical protein